MCGITGFITKPSESEAELRALALRMARAIERRGPDDEGSWSDARHGIAFGHRRLAIVDLSPQGHQPMASACERYMLAYNGEIYNHLELRDALPGHPWRGHSDTETVLACFSRWGVLETLPRLIGMFAMAIWDRERDCLILARDRMGEKPLFYGHLPSGDFVFGSELKALRAYPRWQAEIDRDALALYMRHNAVPAPRSIYRGIHKLMPGAWIEVDRKGLRAQGRYWDLEQLAPSWNAAPIQLSDAAATDELERLLGQALRGQMMADVPLGAFLSGGVDSSTIVALMQTQSQEPVRSFSVGFDVPGYNEAEHAKAVAAHLGTQHTELYVSSADALAVIPQLPTLYDEPFADSSQIPTFLVAQMARRHVTVALSGDAGDELFAGYTRYDLARRLWGRLSRYPLSLRRAAAHMILTQPAARWSRLAQWFGALLPALRTRLNVGDKLHKFAAHVLTADSPEQIYRALVSHWHEPAALVLGGHEPGTALDRIAIGTDREGMIAQMSLLDQLTYLPDDILVKVDRASMGVSLETRVPLLDARVIEFCHRLPMHQKQRDGQTKWLLRQVLYRHVPRHLIERPKQGFAVPLDQWLRGPLRDWAEHLLEPARLQQDGLLDARLVRQKWEEHLAGTRNWQYQLWDVLMLQAWLEATEARR
jgi:asparagine synthase (glutamine-hydrolysing)